MSVLRPRLPALLYTAAGCAIAGALSAAAPERIDEFQGHTERVGTGPGTVMFYAEHTNGKESGTALC